MIVLDTNVVSEFMRTRPDETVVKWLESQPSDEIWTTTITVYEIQHGLNILPDGKRKRGLIHQFELALQLDFADRILDFNSAAALAAAEISAEYKKQGQGADVRDMQIAGIVAAKNWALATRNTKDFRLANITLVDPWDVAP